MTGGKTAGYQTPPPGNPLPVQKYVNGAFVSGGSTAQLRVGWKAITTKIITPGYYATAPNVQFFGWPFLGGTAQQTATCTIGALPWTANGENGQFKCDTLGAHGGISGTSGYPLIADGAFCRSAGVQSHPASGGTVPMAANTDHYDLLGSSDLSSLTIKLPPLLPPGVIRQSFEVNAQVGVTTLYVQDTTGTAIATTSVAAGGTKLFKSYLGAQWIMLR